MVGTPGFIMGRRVVIGNIAARDLNAVIKDEAKRPTYCS